MRVTKAIAIERLEANGFFQEANYLRMYKSSVPGAGSSGWDGHIKSKKHSFNSDALAVIWDEL